MPDWIRFVQRVVGRLTGQRELFALTPEVWGAEGLEPSALRERQTRLGRLFGTRFFSRTYPGIPGRVHVHESMLQNDSAEELAHYVKVGRSAMQNIEASLAAAGRAFSDIGACLDMACGYGRVLRLLTARLDPRRITACDIDEEAVRFCAREFGVRPLVSQKNLRQVRFPAAYDLIWVGSLFTHLEPAAGLDLLDQLVGLLNPQGLLIFSTQGASCLEHISFYGWVFVPREAMYREDMATKGLAYSPYFPSDPAYGITMYRQDKLERIMEERFGGRMKLVRFKERGWDDHQDVWAYQKVG